MVRAQYHVYTRRMTSEALVIPENVLCWDPIKLLADGEGGPSLFPNLRTLTIDFGGLDSLGDGITVHNTKLALVDMIIATMAGRKIKTEKLLVGGLWEADAEKLISGLSWGRE